jgi:hypothetical protein
MDFRSYLEMKLRQAFSEEWDPERPTRVEVVEDGDLVGIRLLVRRRDEIWSLVHEEIPVALGCRQDADDLLARSLSVFLMQHPNWPR